MCEITGSRHWIKPAATPDSKVPFTLYFMFTPEFNQIIQHRPAYQGFQMAAHQHIRFQAACQFFRFKSERMIAIYLKFITHIGGKCNHLLCSFAINLHLHSQKRGVIHLNTDLFNRGNQVVFPILIMAQNC